MRRLAQFLNVREEESRLVAVAFAYSMALGFARIFLVPSQALFLERFEASQLAWGYLASAGGSVVVGAAYIRISRSMATVPLAVLNLVLTGSMTLLLWALLVLGDAGWVRLALFAWNLIFYAFASLAFWNATGYLGYMVSFTLK